MYSYEEHILAVQIYIESHSPVGGPILARHHEDGGIGRCIATVTGLPPPCTQIVSRLLGIAVMKVREPHKLASPTPSKSTGACFSSQSWIWVGW